MAVLFRPLQEVLAAWLNFARGNVGYFQNVPSLGLSFEEAMSQVETILLEPTPNHSDYVRVKDIAQAINLMDKDNPACSDSQGDGSAAPQTGGGSDEKGNKGGHGKGKNK